MKRLSVFFAAIALLGLAGISTAQTADHTVNVAINGFQIIRVNTSAAVTLTIVAPATPGDAVVDVTENSHYMQYSVIRVGTTSYKVTGVIQAGTMPTGLGLYVTAATPGAGGAGTKGTTATEKLLSGSATDLLTGISNCYTGTGGTDGSQLTYRLTVSDFANVAQAASTAITVRYTITS